MYRTKIEVFDWIRGLASLAVIFGHFKPWGIPKGYFIWAVHAFMLITAALLSQTGFDRVKLIKRVSYLLFVYTALFLLFRLFFIWQGSSKGVLPISFFFLNFQTVFIENPYFTHLWYLFIYLQLLVFLLFAAPFLKKWDMRYVLALSLILSGISFVITYYGLGNYATLLLPSWFFVIASGWYLLPRLVPFVEKAEAHRLLRFLASLVILGLIFAPVEWAHWLLLPSARVSIPSTLVYFVMIYALMELYFLLRAKAWFWPLKKFIFAVSRYTLAIYIAHQGIETLLEEPYAINPEWLTLISIPFGIFAGYVLHEIFLQLEKTVEPWFPAKQIKPVNAANPI